MLQHRVAILRSCFALLLLVPCVPKPVAGAERHPEGPLGPFLEEAVLEIAQVYEQDRFPNVAVTLEGTVIAMWGTRQLQVRRSEDGGRTWGEPILIAEQGIHGGGLTLDEVNGHLWAFVEERHPPAPLTVYRSRDDGKTWQAVEVAVRGNSLGHVPAMHMNEAGITLRHGEHAGRLLRATRWYAAGNQRGAWPDHYTNAMFSDDRGLTWQASEPFPERGTGEAAVAELSDGRIYYNSRVHLESNEKPLHRRHAYSSDGGKTWHDWAVVEVLPDGDRHRAYGCMGGLVRLPVEGRDILLFSNLDTDRAERERITVWASFDGGETWPVKRLVFDGPSAYSSLSAGRPGTVGEGRAYLFFEGPRGSGHVARFNLSWLLAGERTGDGELPAWVRSENE